MGYTLALIESLPYRDRPPLWNLPADDIACEWLELDWRDAKALFYPPGFAGAKKYTVDQAISAITSLLEKGKVIWPK